MAFASRADAGQKLGQYLKERGVSADMVLGLPRGGVVVAAEVARVLQLPLDVLIVRKIGHPLFREFAVGALAEEDVLVIDEAALKLNPALREDLDEVAHEETERLHSYESRFHFRGRPDVVSRTVLLVDDGLATGATTEAAVLSVRKKGASRIMVAAPVASTHAVQRLSKVADEVEAILVDPDFDAVGRYYQMFSQTTDQEVLELLAS